LLIVSAITIRTACEIAGDSIGLLPIGAVWNVAYAPDPNEDLLDEEHREEEHRKLEEELIEEGIRLRRSRRGHT
jgi:hypothetical protein